MSTTVKHRTAFALALQAVSPSLSALHASRLRLEHPTEPPLSPRTCVRCGHAPVRVRKRGGVVEKTCGPCGLVEGVPVPRGGAVLFESTRKRRKIRAAPAVESTPPTPEPPPEPTTKRAKKKSGLQEMLARNRERQEKQKQKQGGTGGLSSFLEGL